MFTRTPSLWILTASLLLACDGASTARPPTLDASHDIAASDLAPTADAAPAEAAVDVPLTGDVPLAGDTAVAVDVPAVVDVPTVVDVPAVVDVHAAIDASSTVDAPVGDGGARCLPAVTDDLLTFIDGLDFARSAGPARMVTFPVGSDTWNAARDAALAWSASDCAGFASAATRMGYRAIELTDRATSRRHWVLYEPTAVTHDGVFVFRAPDERRTSRPLVIDSPHYGFDFTDTRAARAYRELDAVAFLQNTAHRCNLDARSGCSMITNYACGDDEMPRASDVAHSVDQLYFAVFHGLELARDDLHFEYHGASADTMRSGCVLGTANLSQAAGSSLASTDYTTFPDRFWLQMELTLGSSCACYHQRETGCVLSGFGSTPGRRTNSEAVPDAGAPSSVCTTTSTALAGRFVHMEAYGVDPAIVIRVLGDVIPHP